MLAENQQLREMSLAQLLIGPDPSVIDDAAANPALPHPRMYRVLADACLSRLPLKQAPARRLTVTPAGTPEAESLEW
jgi:hypothetical protein